jgi:transposase-like protein
MAAKGRKVSQLEDTKVKLLLSALKGGNYIEVACNYAGLAPSTVYRWIERGRAEKASQELGKKPDPTESQYVELCEAVEKARADAILRNVTIIQQAAGNGQWQAAAWWLERSMPQQYGRRIQAEVSATVSVQELEQRMLALLGDDEATLSEDESGAA